MLYKNYQANQSQSLISFINYDDQSLLDPSDHVQCAIALERSMIGSETIIKAVNGVTRPFDINVVMFVCVHQSVNLTCVVFTKKLKISLFIVNLSRKMRFSVQRRFSFNITL